MRPSTSARVFALSAVVIMFAACTGHVKSSSGAGADSPQAVGPAVAPTPVAAPGTQTGLAARVCRSAQTSQINQLITSWYGVRDSLASLWGATSAQQSSALASSAQSGAGQMTLLQVQLRQQMHGFERRQASMHRRQAAGLHQQALSAPPVLGGLRTVKAQVRILSQKMRAEWAAEARAEAWQHRVYGLLRTGIERSVLGLEKLSIAYTGGAVGADYADFAAGASALAEADQLMASAAAMVTERCGTAPAPAAAPGPSPSPSPVMGALGTAMAEGSAPAVGGPTTVGAAAVEQGERSTGCNSSRWSVKTLSDSRAKRVAFRPVAKRVNYLRDLPAPAGLDGSTPRLNGTERTTFRVSAQVVEASVQSDHDVHMVIAPRGARGDTMIVEFPDPNCRGARTSIKHRQMAAARSSVLAACGHIPAGTVHLHGKVVVTGVGFFDDISGQNGQAPNGIELHPVLGFSGTCRR